MDSPNQLEVRIRRIEERLDTLARLFIMSNPQGPDPTSAPEASDAFFRLRNELLVDLGMRNENQGSLLEV